ncbi:hypothetical protein HN858_02985 [Candidatus Falkowbacteria bacterium]|jgi:hypothetical protein|nr:hypothetical protein [Candidatus Falkowbacteria bacterium]MBT6574049.1 hypothetical protein [Candidatus Falkowbacteria bacterium]MBT7348618.1 hypothetical protein [Candidatus Falkowbacteria bacterium]MBT7500409.1 hypothetical protein [Candidatus Falkowbacteria bacterium]
MYSHRHFPNQKPNEHILMFLRRHWLEVLKIALTNICLAAIPIIFFVIIYNYTNYFESDIIAALIVLLGSAFYLFVILYAFTNFVDYYLDVWIVTNQRIINIEQKGLFSRIVSEKDLGQMQDITSEVDGFWATLLNFGNVHIQTAGEKERFVFKQVPFASEVSRRISNLVAEYNKMEKTKEV